MFLSLTGAYQMLPEPGQYPSPFPKVAALVPPVHPEAMMPSLPDQDVVQLVRYLCVHDANMQSFKLSSEFFSNPWHNQ